MKIAIVKFPGTNREQDMFDALFFNKLKNIKFLTHTDTNLESIDLIIIPGGFSYGDYLRSGAIAARTLLMSAIKTFANYGGHILGVCNGFQILTESGLLPGTLIQNKSRKFICCHTSLVVENNKTIFTKQYKLQETLRIPIAHMNGCYYINDLEYQELKKNKQIILRYQEDINGSCHQIAGITNKAGNIFGMMPHFENAIFDFQASQDGRALFQSLKKEYNEQIINRRI